ncbi:methyltransferase domain-containing protein [Actinomycetaceae bacterium L2_0104]
MSTQHTSGPASEQTAMHRPIRYTHGHEKAVLASHAQRTAATCAAYLLPHLRPGMSLLDVGSGPGTITLDLAEAVAPGEVVGIENTEPPIVAASQYARDRGDERTRFLHADVMELPFQNGAFDVVHAHQVLQHLSDPVRALGEMRRVCKPGGLIAVRDADYAAISWYPDLPELEHWRSLYRAIAHGNQADPDAGRHLRSWARAAGLTDMTITSSNFCYATVEDCLARGESQAQRVDGPAFRTQAGQLGASDGEITAIAGAWRTWGAYPDAFFLIPNTEVLARVS